MFRQAPSRIVAVEVEQEGPDRLHVEAREIGERLGEFRVGFFPQHDRAVVLGTGAKIACQHLGAGILNPPRAGMGLERGVFLSLPGSLAGLQRQEVADEGIEVFLAVPFEAPFDGTEMIGMDPFLAFPVERHQDEVADHVGAAQIAAAGVHGLEDAVRVVLPLLEFEGDDAELAKARAQ